MSFLGLLFGIFLLGDLRTSHHLGDVVITFWSGLRQPSRLCWLCKFLLLRDVVQWHLRHFLSFRNLGLFDVARFLNLLFLLNNFFWFFSLGFWLMLFLGSASWFRWLLLLFLLWFFFYFLGAFSFIHHWHEHIRVSILWLLCRLFWSSNSLGGLFLNNCRLFNFLYYLLFWGNDWLWFLLLDLYFLNNFFWSFYLWYFLWLFFVRFPNNWLLKDLVNDLNFCRITSRESWVEFYWRTCPLNRLLNSLFICLDSLKLIVFLFIIIRQIINFFDSILSLFACSRFLNSDNLLFILVMDHERELITCNWSNNIGR